jgi:chromosomal replication initiation ATPase DnaA
VTNESLSVIREWANKSNDYKPDQILLLVAEVTGVSPEDINGGRRFASLMKARHLYWACLRQYCRLSYPAIGYLTSKHHTTIMTGIKKVPSEVINAVGDLYDERNPQ